MGQSTQSARDVAKLVSKALHKDVDAKRVRAWVRDHIDAYDDDGYTVHAYTPATVRTIVAGMTKSASAPRSTSAANGRKAKPRAAKPAATTPTDGAE